jgi:hypothetical protein
MPHSTTRALPMRFDLWVATCGLLVLATTFGAATSSAQSAVKTGKERLGEKASDEQRVDNCNVPPERWGKKARSAACGRDAKAGPTH